MSKITAALVKELREKTSVGMIECKAALVETKGDMQAAINLLRLKGSMRELKEGRTTNEGTIAVLDGTEHMAIVELNCETDFVARNDMFTNLAGWLVQGTASDADIREISSKLGENITVGRKSTLFINDGEVGADYLHSNAQIGVIVVLSGEGATRELAKDIAMHIAATGAKYVSRDDVPTDEVEKEKAFLLTQPDIAAKPENIRPKMIEGRLSKFFAGMCLLEQPFVKDPSVKVQALLKNAKVEAFRRYQVGEVL